MLLVTCILSPITAKTKPPTVTNQPRMKLLSGSSGRGVISLQKEDSLRILKLRKSKKAFYKVRSLEIS